jgi:minor histocompatibility antigen H13
MADAKVFATPVMVTVAKGLDAPIKLLAPKPSTGGPTDFAMLGLGDVVIPGLMIALCLRFDLAQHARRNPGKTDPAQVGPRASFPRPYFWTGILSYLVGLGVTIGVMQHFKRAQPALLYLSPACSELLACMYAERGYAWER